MWPVYNPLKQRWELPVERRRLLFCLSVATVVYTLVAILGLSLASLHSHASPVWPASGLAVAATLLLGPRIWPALFAGAWMANLWQIYFHTETDSLPAALLAPCFIAAGNTGEALAGAWLIERFAGGTRLLDHAPNVLRFAWAGSLLPPLISMFFGVGALFTAGLDGGTDFQSMALTWWCGNWAGILLVTPLILAWARPFPFRFSKWPALEALLITATLIFAGQTLCGIYLGEALRDFPRSYMTIPVLLWAGIRFGKRGLVLALLALALIAVLGTVRGFAAFPGENPNQSLLHLQIFMGIVSVLCLFTVCLVDELQRTLVELDKVNEELEARVETRTLRLAEVIEEKNELMAIAAHDLQGPLTGVRNLAEQVLEKPALLGQSLGREIMAEIKRTCEGMDGLIRRLWDYLDAEQKHEFMPLEEFDPATVLQETVEMFCPAAAAKNIELQVHLPTRTLCLRLEKNAVHQILGNLLSNAVKFSRPGSRVEILLQAHEDGARLVVSDQGPGLAPGDLLILFRKFVRLQAKPTGGENSTGLGLYIVRKLTQRMGGSIRCESLSGDGATFILELPYSTTAASHEKI
jgi:signal transduction histidine kinase